MYKIIRRKAAAAAGIAAASAVTVILSSCFNDERMPEPFETSTVSLSEKADTVKEGVFLKNDFFVIRWNVMGPLPADGADPLHTPRMDDEKNLDGSRNSPDGSDACWHVQVFTSGKNKDAAKVPGMIDLNRIFMDKKEAQTFYAVATLETEDDLSDLKMHVGTSGMIKIWLNSELIYTNEKADCVMKLDEATVENLKLKEKYNKLVVKYVDGKNTTGVRQFSLRFTDAHGNPVRVTP